MRTLQDLPDDVVLLQHMSFARVHARAAQIDVRELLESGPRIRSDVVAVLRGTQGVAVVTTRARLRESLASADVIISPVRCIDCREESLTGRDYLLQQLIHKRIAFEHERELRVLHRPREAVRIGLPLETAESGPLDKSVPRDAERALDCLIPSPFAPALANRLTLSELGADPVFQELIRCDVATKC